MTGSTHEKAAAHRQPAAYDRAKHGTHNLYRPEIISEPQLYTEAIRELGPVFYDEVGRVWVCSGYAESLRILTDHQVFTAARLPATGELRQRSLRDGAGAADLLAEQMLFNDPPEHSALRSALAEEFTPAAVRRFTESAADIVDTALDLLPNSGEIDLVTDFAARLSSPLVARLLGVPDKEDEITRWAAAYETLLGSVSSLPDVRDSEILTTLSEAMEAFTALAAARVPGSGPDLVSALVRGVAAADDRNDEWEAVLRRVAANCIVVAGGGYQTLTHLVTTGLVHLAHAPQQQRDLREHPELIGSAVNEFMRLDGSSQYVARKVIHAAGLAGQHLAEGDTVLVHLGAANLDPRRFTDPTVLDIRRAQGRHLGFGMGRHHCLGAPYAEQMAALAITRFLSRYDQYLSAGTPTWGPHPNTRCMRFAPIQVGSAPGTDQRTVHSPMTTGPATTWHARFTGQARTTPDAVAVEQGETLITYRQLNSRGDAIAHRLREELVEPESTVALVMDRSPDFIAAILGVAKAGGAFLLADTATPPERLSMMLAEARVSLVLTDDASRTALPTMPEGIRVLAVPRGLGYYPPNTGAGPGNSAYVVFTSGSTGRPKAIVVNHDGVIALSDAQREIFRLRPEDRVLQFLSPNFDGCVADIVLALLSGARLVLPPPGPARPGPELGRLLADKAITAAILTPSLWASTPAIDLPELRIAAAAGERLTAALVRRWWAPHRRFLNLYGPAEAAVMATWHECRPDEPEPPIGLPVTGKHVHVVDSDLQPVPVGVEGELVIGGRGIGRYLARADLMQARFAPDTSADGGAGLVYRTGDIGRWRRDGAIEYVGRRDRQVKVRGQRVELGEVEQVLARMPGVLGCRALVVGDDLVAELVGSPTELPDDVLRRELARTLHTGMVPNRFRWVDEVEVTENGKSNWNTSGATDSGPHEAEPGEVRERGTMNPSQLVWIIARHFAQCLDQPVAAIKYNTDFYSAGGDSLSSAQLLTLTEQTFGIRVDHTAAVEDCTPTTLAGVVHATLARAVSGGR